MSLQLVLIFGYAALQAGLGLWLGRRVRTSSDFFVAGRALGPGLLFSTLIAANIGAGSTVGAAGLGYRDGLGAWWWVGSAGLGSLVLAFSVGPRIRRLAAQHDLRTVGDYLDLRFGPSVRGVVAAVLWVGTLAILAGQLIAVAWVLHAVAGLPKWAGCLIGGAVMTTYFAAGGLLVTATVNAAQLVVELSVFALLVPFALAAAGGWEVVAASAPRASAYWSFGIEGGGPAYLALLAPAFVVSPGLLQKIYGARDDRAVRMGVGANAVVLLVFALVPTVLGIVARARYPQLVNPELALPTILARDLPALLGALGLAAVFTAEVNTADALLFMLSTSLSQDLYRRFVNPGASDAQVLRVARWAAIGGGTLGVAFAVMAPSVIGVLSVFYTLLTVCLFVPVLGGLYVPRVGTPEALAAIGTGLLGTLGTIFAKRLGSTALPPPVVVGLATGLLGCAATGLARRLGHFEAAARSTRRDGSNR